MAWQQPKLTWQPAEPLTNNDMNRIEGNIDYLKTDLDAHKNAPSAHGVSGNIVGTSDTQTLTNKTLGSGTTLGADLNANSNKIINLAAPTSANDAATKGYIDSNFVKLTDYEDADVLAKIKNVDGSGSGLDADLLDGYHVSSFSRIDGHTVKYSASGLSPGWYTIAVNYGNRAVARFGIRDTYGGAHQNVVFYASHMYGVGNEITVLHSSRFNTTPIRYIRIKKGGTFYDGALLQIYVDTSANSLEVYLLGDNFQYQGWILKNFVPDGTDPGDVNNFSALTNVAAQVDLDNIIDGGMATTGEIYAGGKTTQYKVWHEGNSNFAKANLSDLPTYRTTASSVTVSTDYVFYVTTSSSPIFYMPTQSSSLKGKMWILKTTAYTYPQIKMQIGTTTYEPRDNVVIIWNDGIDYHWFSALSSST